MFDGCQIVVTFRGWQFSDRILHFNFNFKIRNNNLSVLIKRAFEFDKKCIFFRQVEKVVAIQSFEVSISWNFFRGCNIKKYSKLS